MNPYKRFILQKEFKKIENMALRCYNCSYIPKFKLNFENYNLLIICDKCNKLSNEPNKIYQIDIIAYTRTFLEDNKCKLCKNYNNLYFCEESNSMICEPCILKNKSKIKDGDKNYIYEDSTNYNSQLILNENNLILNEVEKTLNPKIIGKLPYFLLSKKELESLKKELNYIENSFNEINFSVDDRYIFLSFCISFIKSLIYTYETMTKNKYINYNIIYNIRKIKIKKNNDINQTIPFYNVNINKYLLEEKYFEIIKDEYINEKILNIRNKIDCFMNGGDYKFYLSDNNDLIFFNTDMIRLYNNNLNFLTTNGDINLNIEPHNSILNYLNYTFQILNNHILIQKYVINNNNIVFVEYQKIEINEVNEEYELFADSKSKKVYFFFKKKK